MVTASLDRPDGSGESHGFNLFATVYGSAVPLIVGYFLWRKVTPFPKAISIKIMLWGGAGVISLALLFAVAIPENGFIRFRDRLLLNHRAGQTVNGFYYRYTLFAAEAIKTNTQKQLLVTGSKSVPAPRLIFRIWKEGWLIMIICFLDEQDDDNSADLTLKVLPTRM